MNPAINFELAVRLGLLALANSRTTGWSLLESWDEHYREFHHSPTYKNWADLVWLLFALQYEDDAARRGTEVLYYQEKVYAHSVELTLDGQDSLVRFVRPLPHIPAGDRIQLPYDVNGRWDELLWRLLQTGSLLNPNK